MYKSKIISILSTLSNKELKWFEAFILSPFYSKNKNARKLFTILKKFHPEYEEDKVAMEAIFPKMFPKEELQEQKLRYVMTDLTKLLEEYLAHIEFEKDQIYKKHLLLKAYHNRNMDKYFQAELENVRGMQEKSPYRDVGFYFNQYLLESDAYEHDFSVKQRGINTGLQRTVDNLDLYYLSNRLRYSAGILNREDLFQEKYNNLFLEEILTFLSRTNLENYPSISIYHSITMMFRAENSQPYYYKLKELLAKYDKWFADEEIYDMYTQALNYCIRKINSGEPEFLKEMLDLYRVLVEREIIFENGYIAPGSFKNIVALAMRTGQQDWGEQFIEQYKDRITPEYRENTYIYNLANLYYSKRDFSKALRLMQTVDMTDIYYHLDAKVLLLKTYYELDEAEPFFSLTDAYTNYLKRNKLISDSQRQVYLNFVKYARKLMQLRLGSRLKLEDVKEELMQLSQIANLQWLTEKLDEIERNL